MSAWCPSMCSLPLAKRHPFQLEHFDAVNGQSKRLKRIRSGTFTVIPPTLSISSSKRAKSTMATWLTSMPVSWRTVATASAGPPSWKAPAAVTAALEARLLLFLLGRLGSVQFRTALGPGQRGELRPRPLTPVDAVGLLLAGHRAGYGSRRG